MIKFLKNLILLLMFFQFFSAPAQSQAIFEKHLIDDNFDQAAGLFACDLDGDGDTDVLCAGGGGGIAWWRNEGGKPIVWAKFTIDSLIDTPLSAYAIDVDGDNDVDVLGAGWFSNDITFYRNDGGNPIVWTKQTIANFSQAHEVYASDFDGDGDADVFGASAGSNQVAWWRNDGGNPIVWVKQVIDNNIRGARSIFVADFDGDNDLDAVGAGLTSNEVSWYRNDGGDPILWTEFTVSNSFNGSHRVYACDMDLDGDQDILGAAYAVNQIAWWRNDGGNPISWTKQVIDGQCSAALVAHAADLDGDGDIDVVSTANNSDDIAWYRNDGGEPIVWKKEMLDANFDGAWPVYVCDIDGDGDVDILGGADTADDVAWWENINVFLKPSFGAAPSTGNAPVTIQFIDSSLARPQANSWQWDFNNDGTIDSQEKNPSWTFDQAGNYTVKLVVSNNSLTETFIQQNFIRVFDGECALEFDGKSSVVKCPANPILNLTNSVTIEAWINPKGYGSLQNLGFGRIVDKKNISLLLNGEGGSLNKHSLAIWLATTGGSAGFACTSENSISLNQWQHVAVTYDANLNVVKIYINGSDQSLRQASGQPAGAIIDNSQVDLLIGNSANRMAFDGIIDEARVWNIVRSAENIQANMNHYLKGNEPGLIAYWQMNEGNGTTIADGSGHSNNGTNDKAMWIAGNKLENPVGVEMNQKGDASLPEQFSLDQNYPNPFNSSTVIQFHSPRAAKLSLKIYDLTGRLVNTLVDDKSWQAGSHSIRWDGLNILGEPVASGVYFYQLKGADFFETKKALYLK